MRSTQSIAILVVLVISICAVPVARSFSPSVPSLSDPDYVIVGGQNGTWFEGGQAPRLVRVELANYSETSLSSLPGGGTVWGGGWNGSQWLISGWGDDEGVNGSNPYIYLYDGRGQVIGGSTDQYQAEATWHGGDVFATSYNGKEWLLSGLGSGNLSQYGMQNHMSLSLFDGYNFTDLSSSVPNQKDAILYANAWNGRYWLIGGGYEDEGVLFSFDGNRIADLTAKVAEAVPSFGSVQSVAWNGAYWLIGGVNFLAAYDGNQFTDLTDQLDTVITRSGGCCSSVNAIAWNGEEWMIGGGTPVAQTTPSQAWLVEYSAGGFTDLTPQLSRISLPSTLYPEASILSIAAVEESWVIGGYLNGHGWLLQYSGGSFTNLSQLVGSFTYVNWVGADAVPNSTQSIALPPSYNPSPQPAMLEVATVRLI